LDRAAHAIQRAELLRQQKNHERVLTHALTFSFASCGRSARGGIDWYRYNRCILQPLLLPAYQKFKASHANRALLMQDGASNHTSQWNRPLFMEQEIDLLFWPGNSPDLNPIEHIWNLIKDRVSRRRPFIKGRLELELAWHAGSKKTRTAKISPHPTTKFTHNFWRTMEPEDHHQNHETPTKAKIQGAIEFCERMNIPYYKNDVFRTFNVSKRQGYEMLRPDSSSRRRHNDPDEEETRGRKGLITAKHIREMEKVLEEEGFEARALTWEQLGYEVGLDCSGDTVKRAMGTMNYHKCIACRKGWVSPRTATRRVEYAVVMLEKYPTKQHWKPVRFSDEVHFGYGPQGKLRIIRKPGQRYCMDCIQEQDSPKDKGLKRQHCWAAIGHEFKSNIYFYDVPGNTNGKLTLKVYLEQILKPIVKPWIDSHPRFVLEEDGDSGHGTGSKNIVRQDLETGEQAGALLQLRIFT